MQNAKVYDLKKRTLLFSVEIIRFLETLTKDYIAQVMGKQLLRSATSIGANIIEGYASSSRKDFAQYYNIALKSANETKYWLMLLKTTKRGSEQTLETLLAEAVEISNILAKSLMTIRGK